MRVLFGFITALSVFVCVPRGSSQAAAGSAPGAVGDADTYFAVTADGRKCAWPLCGGWFLKRLNQSTTVCHDGREMGPSVVVSHDLAQAGAQAAQRAAAHLAGIELPPQSGPTTFDPALLKAGLGFKGAKQTVVDAFEIAYLAALMARNDGNITRSAQEAGLTRYHLRELLKRHGLKGGEQE